MKKPLEKLIHPPLWLLAGRLALAALLLWLGTLPEAPAWRLALHAMGWVLASADVAMRLPAERRTEVALWLAASLYAFAAGMSGGGLFCAIAFRAAWEASAQISRRAFSRGRERLDVLPDSALIFRAGEQITVPPERVVPGDAVIVLPGTVVPVDALVVKGESLTGLAALTGEAQMRTVKPGDRVYAGMNNETGLLAVKAEKTGEDTLARRGDRQVTDAALRQSRPERRWLRLCTAVGAGLALAGLLLCVLPTVLGWENAPLWRQRAAGVLIAACPLAAGAFGPALRMKAVFDAARAGGRAAADTLWALARMDMAVLDESGLMEADTYQVTGLDLAPGTERDSLLRCAAISQTGGPDARAKAICDYCGDIGCPPDSLENRHGGVVAKFSGHVIHAGKPLLLRAHGIDCPDDGPSEVLRVALDGRLLGGLRIGRRMRHGAEELPHALQARHMDTALMTGLPPEDASALGERLCIRDLHAELSDGDKARVFDELLTESRGRALLVSAAPGHAAMLAKAAVAVIPDGWEKAGDPLENRIVLPGHSPAPLDALLAYSRGLRRRVIMMLWLIAWAKAACLALAFFEPSLLWLNGLCEALLTVLLTLFALRGERADR